MKNRNLLIALGVIIVVAVVGIAAFFIRSGSGEASAPISAPTLSLDTTEEVAQEPTEPAVEATEEAQTTAVEATEMVEAEVTEAATEEAAVASAERAIFRIVPEESEVRFTLSELLRGSPVTVIARTNQVAGDIIVDFSSPSNSEVGVIRINVRTMATDSSFRDRAIRGEILQSARDEFEFSEFTPTELRSLPDSVTIGESFTFEIVGSLKVRDISSEVIFEATVTPVSETRLEGSATAVIQRATYNLTIPNAPGVAEVSEDVGLEIDFVATQVES